MATHETRIDWRLRLITEGDRAWLKTQRDVARATEQAERAERQAQIQSDRTTQARQRATRTTKQHESDLKQLDTAYRQHANAAAQVQRAERTLDDARMKARLAGAKDVESESAVKAARLQLEQVTRGLTGREEALAQVRKRVDATALARVDAERRLAEATTSSERATKRATTAETRRQNVARTTTTTLGEETVAYRRLNAEATRALARIEAETTQLTRNATAHERAAVAATRNATAHQRAAATATAGVPVTPAQAARGAGRVAAAVNTVGSIAGAGGLFALGRQVGDALAYEKQMAAVNAVLEGTQDDMRQLSDLVIELGARTKFSASESAVGLEILAKAGFDTKAAMTALPGTLDLAAASATELGVAADIQTATLKAFNLEVEQSGHVADVLTMAANKSAVDVADLGESLKYVAPTAQAAGQSFEDVSAALAIMGDSGIKGSQAGTTLNAFMTRILNPSKKATGALRELGLSAQDLQGPNGLLPLPEILAKITAGAEKLPKAQQRAALATIFGREPIAGVTTMVDKGSAALREFSDEFQRADGFAKQTARTMQNNVMDAVEELGGAIESGSIRVLERYQPQIQKATRDIAASIEAFVSDPAKIDQVERSITNAGEAIATAGEAMGPFVEAAKLTTEAWGAMPDGVQRSIVQFGILTAIAKKVAGSAALGGITKALRANRAELAATAAQAKTTGVVLATATVPSGAAAARSAGATAPAPSVVPVSAGQLGRAGFGVMPEVGGVAALRTVDVTSQQIAQNAQAAQREASQLLRRKIEAQRAVAVAEMAEAQAQRQAIGARALPRTAANAGAIEAAQAQLASAKLTTAAAREAATAAAAESAGAKQRLVAARQIQAAAATNAKAATAAAAAAATPVAVAAPTAGQRVVGGVQRAGASLRGIGMKGGAIAGGAGLAGAAMSGGDPLSGAVSGAAIGMMAGPWGAAIGGALGAIGSKVIGEFRKGDVRRAEEAARKYAEDVRNRTQAAFDQGISRSTAQRTAGAAARLSQADRFKADAQTAIDGRDLFRYMDIEKEAKAAGFDLTALLKGTSDAYKRAGTDAAKAFTTGLDDVKFANARGVLDRFRAQLGNAPRESQKQGAAAAIQFAKGLEASGHAPAGTVERLIRGLDRQWDGLGSSLIGKTQATAKRIADALADPRIPASVNVTAGRITERWSSIISDLPRTAVRTIPGAVATLNTQMDKLRDLAKHAPTKELREAAQRDLNQLRSTYRSTFNDLAKMYGASKDDARSWGKAGKAAADQVAAAGGTAAEQIEAYRRTVQRLGQAHAATAEAVRSFSGALDDLPAKLQAVALVASAASVRDIVAGLPVDGRRRGGRIPAFRGGGILAAVSSGELLRYPNGAWAEVPGPRVAADNVLAVLPEDTEVYTGHGIGMLAAGYSREETLAAQLPHFNTGGKAGKKTAKAARVGYTVYDDPPPGAFGALTNGYAELGTARRTDGRGTGYGWIARARGMSGELPKDTPLTVRINGKQKTLRKRDRGYGQGGDGVRSDSRYAIDIWKDSWGAFGLSRSSKGTATVALGAGVKGLGGSSTSGQAALREHTVTRTTDDLTGRTARNAAREMRALLQPNVSDAFTQGYGAGQARARTLRDVDGLLPAINVATRVNLERTRQTISGRDASAATRSSSRSSSSGKLDTSRGVLAQARKAKTPALRGAKAGMASYAKMGAVFGLGVSSGLRPGAITSSGKPSQHGAGDALDISGSSTGMLRFAKWLGSSGVAKGADQVIHTPLGYGWTGGRKVGLGYFGDKVNKDHYDHVHIGDSTPPRLRGGGVVRRYAGGGTVRPGTARAAADLTASGSGRAKVARQLRDMFGAATRENSRVTDALDRLGTLLTDAELMTAERLTSLSVSTRKAIRQTVAKGSPAGKAISKGEEALIRRARGVRSLVMGELGRRAGDATAMAAKVDTGIGQYQAAQDRGLRRAGIDASSAAGIQAGLDTLGVVETARHVQRGHLAGALELAQRAGKSGAEQARDLQRQLDTLDDEIKDLAVQRIEQARALVRQHAQERLDAAQFTRDLVSADTAIIEATQRVRGIDGTPQGMRELAERRGLDQAAAMASKTAWDQAGALAWDQGDINGWRQAMLGARQALADATSAEADRNRMLKEASSLAAQQTVSRADYGLSVAQLQQQGLALRQQLAGTYDGGAVDRAAFIRATVIPAIQRQITADQAQVETERRTWGAESDQFRAAMLKLLQDQNALAQAQLDEQEEIRKNTASRSFGGSLGFEFGGGAYTDLILDGAGA
ncbi:MAG: phage tail tape measure protein [Solirubrobacteraceae bacterium]|nr:phage tail tape measure protein [Solirubrobacteraceae bacterium]